MVDRGGDITLVTKPNMLYVCERGGWGESTSSTEQIVFGEWSE